jgi:tRNA pseudouridine38-40 synthase
VTPLRRVRIDLAYDGTDFCGWQLQPGRRTVQGVLEETIATLHGGRRVALRAASRTDSGVHAQGQVADCEVRLRQGDATLAYVLRRLLPHDVRPLAVRSMSDDFHSRNHALGKVYRYRIDRTPHGDPFARRFALHHPVALDLDRMRAALRLLPGRHDWRGFTALRDVGADAVRHMSLAELDESIPGEIGLVFGAEGFLRYMVRNLVGTLIEIGKRAMMPVERVGEILERREPGLAGPTAPPRGLHLLRVDYAAEAAGP